MVNIKKKAIKALRELRPRTVRFESGYVNGIHAGPYLVGVDLAAGPDLTIRMTGTWNGYLLFGP